MNFSVSVIVDIMKLVKEQRNPTVFVFVSDHGLSIFEDGMLLSPGSKNAFHVPFIVYGNDSFLDKVDQTKWNTLKRHTKSRITQSYIFETLASLSDIVYDKADPQYDLTVQKSPITDLRTVATGDYTTAIYEQIAIPK